ncbi:Small heat shock protein IbpA [invertebrate metagenome]|uniref:Small heat shock protein IbpA n=1 Tax=invertebrate metagenome TaxID=1711999 RepID=A0A2H9TB35_9ZZZZ
MRTIEFDLSPLYRSSIGFDRVGQLLENLKTGSSQSSYPPYNIERLDDDTYRISMAVAGFSDNELDIETRENVLVIQGNKKQADESRQYLYQGIAERSFERRFQLADYVKVIGARIVNGLLHIELKREIPEAMRPHKIAIQDGNLIESEKEPSLIEEKSDKKVKIS